MLLRNLIAQEQRQKQRGADGRKARVIDRPAILGGIFGVLKLILAPRSGDVGKAVAEADKLIANKILDVIRTMLCKDREVQSFEYTEARKAYFTEQMICEILIALEQAAMSFDMEYDDRQKAMSTELSKAARKEWYLRHKDKGVEP